MPRLASATEEQKLTLSARVVELVAAEYVAFWTSKGKLYSLNDCPPDVTGIGVNIDIIPARAGRRQELLYNYEESGNW